MIYSTIGDPFPVDRPIHLEYKVYDSHTPSGYVGTSVGERIELRLQDPKPGEYCTMDPITTNSEGIIGGDCHTANLGGIVVYAYSLDRGDESNHLYLRVVAPSPSPLSSLTPTPSPSPIQKSITPPRRVSPRPASPAPQTVTSEPRPDFSPFVFTSPTPSSTDIPTTNMWTRFMNWLQALFR
jgi:hypothetical protein